MILRTLREKTWSRTIAAPFILAILVCATPVSAQGPAFQARCKLAKMSQDISIGSKYISKSEASRKQLEKIAKEENVKISDMDVIFSMRNSIVSISGLNNPTVVTSNFYPRKASRNGKTINWSGEISSVDPNFGKMLCRMFGAYHLESDTIISGGRCKGTGKNSDKSVNTTLQFHCEIVSQ